MKELKIQNKSKWIKIATKNFYLQYLKQVYNNNKKISKLVIYLMRNTLEVKQGKTLKNKEMGKYPPGAARKKWTNP